MMQRTHFLVAALALTLLFSSADAAEPLPLEAGQVKGGLVLKQANGDG